MFAIKTKEGKTYSLPSKELSPDNASAVSTRLAESILKHLAKTPSYPKEIAKKLHVNEQLVYYHIHNLERNGWIKVIRKETSRGGKAKFYSLSEPSFIIRFKEYEETQKLFQIKPEYEQFLSPFIENGVLDAVIIVGSPEPHGPEKARSRDGYYGIDFALFLGSFLTYNKKLNVKLDTEAREEDLRNNNLILIGGPIVNNISSKINSKLAVHFESNNIRSTISNKTYTSESSGLIVKAKNPFNHDKSLLLIAGKRYSGTRATIIAFLKYFDVICRGNKHNPKVFAKVVEGFDLDSDGIVDDIEFLE